MLNVYAVWRHYYNGCDAWHTLMYLFKTKEKAQEICDHLNLEEMKKDSGEEIEYFIEMLPVNE